MKNVNQTEQFLKFIFLSGVPKGYLSILNKKRNKFGTLEEYIKWEFYSLALLEYKELSFNSIKPFNFFHNLLTKIVINCKISFMKDFE